MYGFLDKRYALALYEIAEEQGKVIEFIDDLREVNTIINSNDGFKSILENPNIGKPRKKELIIEIFKGKTFEDVVSFLCVLVDKGRILYLEEKIRQMEVIYLERHNILEATVKSVIPLTNQEFSKLHDKLESKYGKKVILTREIDQSIIGGLFVKVGNEVIDGTIAGKYKEIKASMFNSK
ncbi:F0F1 ATP synthase subunit delta [uncultured Clostridium sp.]|jgi:F-type H+-transporting ATPase subunit delta|uniref:F0F1 ATP synthase subunit delta n=1 Tax=uncultured Clostridium sp. TaxID=59620 RepID=UPI00261AB685|nr:F0F1 ATP synthase subunit delta [uncultured Clostridium sp.]